MAAALLAVLLAALGAAALPDKAARPLVGIYPSMYGMVDPAVAAAYYRSYQLWLEQSGAQSIVLPGEGDEGDAERALAGVDGLLLPGGPTRPVQPFARHLLQRAIQVGLNGSYFPVWGTCLGFQWIIEAVAGKSLVEIGVYNASDLAANLEFHKTTEPGRIWASANASMLHWLRRDEVVYMNHEDGVSLEHFRQNAYLTKHFDLVATSFDRKGLDYVAAFEGKTLPIYAVQFHPEKVRYQPQTPTFMNIPRSAQAVAEADFLSSFFDDQVRQRSRHPFVIYS